MAYLPILAAEADEIPDRVLVVGDPKRLDLVRDRLDDLVKISASREYHTIKGYFQGELIGAVSHGVGSAGAGVCFEEICRSGAKRIIRAGSAGGLQPAVTAGHIVLAQAAVRDDGLSHKLVPASFPAVATADLLLHMRSVAQSSGAAFHEGIVLTSDMFYPHDVLGSNLQLWQRAGITAVEMEVATLFVVCALHGVERAAVVAIDGNPLAQDEGSMDTYDPDQREVKTAVNQALDVALATLIH